MKKITFHHEADAEVNESARYYEMRSEGLGFSFLLELETTIDIIAENPEAYQRIGDEVRKKALKRFPYNVIYAVEPDRIRILAVAHQKRRPYYWQSRS